jgi:hypothetical protein
MAARYRGCRLCKPHKGMGNSHREISRRLQRYLDAARVVD